MKRWLVLIGCVVAAVACDPLLPLRVKDEVQPVSELVVLGPSGNLPSGTTANIVVEALDGGDNSINLATKEITITVSNEDVVTVVEGTPKGTLVATGKAVGSATVTVKIDDVSESTTLNVIPGSPGQIALTTGQGQLGVVNDPLLQDLVFQVRDAHGNAVQSGVPVTFTSTSGSVSPVQNTNASGQVTVSYTPGAVGDQSVTARVSTSVQVVVPVTVTTLQPVLTATLVNPRSGIIMTPSPVVQLQYASTGQAYPRSGKTVTATLTSLSGRTLTGTSVTTNSAGIATFDALRISGTAGAITLRFTVTGPGTTVDAPLTLRGGLPASMSITTQPATTTVTGRVFPRVPVIQLLDASGNESPESDVSVLATPTSGSLAGSLAISDATGKVTFSALALTGTPGSRTLSFSSPSHTTLSAVNSASFFVTGVETRLQMDRTTSAFACAAVPTTTPRVQLVDAAGNAVPQSGVTVTAAFVSGTTGATIDAGETAVTDAAGLATFSTLKLKGTAGGYSLDFTAPSLTKTTMATTVTAGAADTIKVQTQPSNTAVNGISMTTSPVVRVYDECNNLATTPIPITVGTTTGSVTFTNGVRNTSGGEATFSSLQLAGLVGNYTLRFTSPNVGTDVATVVTALQKGAAAKVVITTEPATTAASNVNFTTQPKVVITDVGGNGVGGTRTVTATVVTPANGALISGNSATVTTPDSVGTFTAMKLVGVAGSYRLAFASSGLADDTSAAVTLTPQAGTASKITIDTPPASASFSGIVLPRIPVVQLRDVDNDTVHLAGMVVSITSTGNPFTVTNGSLATDAVGKATFTNLSLSGIAQATGTLTFTVAGVTPVNATVANVIAQQIANNSPVAFNESAGTTKYYGLTVPASQAKLTVTISSASGDPELLVRQTDAATTSVQSACSTTTVGTTRTCEILTPAAGTYFITVRSTTNNHSGTLRAVYP